uniref:Plectin/S10 N-terminal domain-containing protein n=1 Tax=Ditylenchus dipsaci TaxID=166011 RepID=A0A915DRB2_9BILA
MLMPKADRKKIYEHLFEDGVCIAKQDYNLKSHPEIKGVKNLYVIKALKSLVSRGLVKEQFAWRHYYFFLNADATHRVKVEQSKSGMPEREVVVMEDRSLIALAIVKPTRWLSWAGCCPCDWTSWWLWTRRWRECFPARRASAAVMSNS